MDYGGYFRRAFSYLRLMVIKCADGWQLMSERRMAKQYHMIGELPPWFLIGCLLQLSHCNPLCSKFPFASVLVIQSWSCLAQNFSS